MLTSLISWSCYARISSAGRRSADGEKLDAEIPLLVAPHALDPQAGGDGQFSKTLEAELVRVFRQDPLPWLEGDLAPWRAHPARGDDYLHNRTGEDNGAAHLRNLTIGHEVIVPVTEGELDLGPWQRIFYGEWDGRRPKRIVLKILGF